MRARLGTFCFLVLLAAGCSATASGFFPDAGPDGGPVSVTATGDAGKDADSGKRKDTGTIAVEEEDSGFDANVKDSGKKDATVVVTTCSPSSTSGFVSSWVPPNTLHSGACTAVNAQLAVDCVFDDTVNQTACTAFAADAGNSACQDCIFSTSTASSYGAIVVSGTLGTLNVAGCIARLSGDVSSSGCGAKLQSLSQCEDYVCSGCDDPGSSQQALDDYLQCQSDADNSACSSYVSAASCADALIQPDAAAEKCMEGNTFLDRARNLAKLFCTL
jgi:hypothetical protein